MPITPLHQDRLEQGLAALAQVDTDIARVLAEIGPPATRVREPSFATLLRIVTAQQLSTKAAAAIWARLIEHLGEVTPARVAACSEADLRACGFSRQKVAYAYGLAEAVASGRLDLAGLAEAADEDAIAQITALKGFGRWSAEIYLLFALGRADAFPADDLAVRVGLQRLKSLAVPLTAKRARELAEPWAPWRGCAALFLWHYYGAATLDRT